MTADRPADGAPRDDAGDDDAGDDDAGNSDAVDGDAVKDLVGQHWHRRAPTFDDESQHGIHTDDQRERWLSVLDAWTGEAPRRTLDVGCGTGVLSTLLAALGHDVTGVDLAPGMLGQARAKARQSGHAIGFARGDAETLPVDDGAVDLVTARHLLWTLPDPAAALREWRRVLVPGGRVVLVEGHWNHDEPRDEYEAVHEDLPMYHGRPPGDVRDLLREAGFDEIAHEPLMDPVLWGRDPRHEYYVLSGTMPG